MRLPPLKWVIPVLGTFSVIVIYGLNINLTNNSMQTEDGTSDSQEIWTSISPGRREETMACPLRKAVKHDPFLMIHLNFSVPVFQWKETFSEHTWKYLNRRLPPYGWKGLPANDLKWILSLINSSDLFDRGLQHRCIRCAVVGNGGILRGSKQGNNIDSHDFVFRVNGAVIKGFEEDVGNKTSFYTFTANTMKNALILYKQDGFKEIPQSPDVKYIFIPASIREYMMIAAAIKDQPVPSGFDKGDKPWRYFGHKPPDSFKILHPDFVSNVTLSLLNSKWRTNPMTRDLYMPSSGAMMLLTALYTCDEVSAFGFITKNYAEFSDHYYDSVRKPLVFYANHDMQMECRLWDDLQRRGVMKLYQRSVNGSHDHGINVIK